MAHILKVVKGTFFGTPYWSGKMKIAAVDRIRPPNDPFWDDIFDRVEGAQRELNKRRVLDFMVPYLLNGAHPFFSAITLIMVPIEGDALKENLDFKFKAIGPDDLDIGTLEIEDQVLLFPADGQHRREAMAQALAKEKGIALQEVPVILLPFESVERVRQLFADLNLNAKPVNKTIGLAYEGRDPVVIVAKRLIQDVPLFGHGSRVNTKSNSLAAKSPAVISMNTLVEVTTHLLAAVLDTPIKQLREHPDLKAIENLEPGDQLVKAVADRVADVLNVAIDAFPAWTDVQDEPPRRTPGQIRDGVKDEAGQTVEEGFLFAFGLGWQALALAAAAIIRVEEEDWSEALQRAIASVNWQKGKHWSGIAMVFDPEFKVGRVNNTGPGIRATAGYILKTAGYGDYEDEDIQGLVAAYEGPRESEAAVAA
jgi:DNA sulfur modification protein DndB